MPSLAMPHNNRTSDVLKEVASERGRQLQLWGTQTHEPDRWLSILMEEIGEAAQAYNDGHLAHYREELVQVTAVACAMIESYDKRKAT